MRLKCDAADRGWVDDDGLQCVSMAFEMRGCRRPFVISSWHGRCSVQRDLRRACSSTKAAAEELLTK